MKIYEKPVVSVDAGMMEGVYMQSGGASSTSGGFTVSFFNKIVYYQENGAETYRASWSSGNVKSITLVFNQNIDSASANTNNVNVSGKTITASYSGWSPPSPVDITERLLVVGIFNPCIASLIIYSLNIGPRTARPSPPREKGVLPEPLSCISNL